MERKVADFMKKNKLLKKNSHVCIGVSGGPDSMALLHYYISIRAQWHLQLTVLSADHQLRGEASRADLSYVKQMCQKWDVPFVAGNLDVQAYKEENAVGTQVAARELRYRFFAEQMTRFQADYLALGHHGDDQVETMLMSFTRSSSTASLGGIPVKRQFATGYIVRPFLCITKSTLERYCRDQHIQPRLDSSNADTHYTRNYFRKHIMPLIKAQNHNIHTIAQHLSTSLHDDEQYLQHKAQKVIERVVNFDKEHRKATFEIKAFKLHALSLQRRGFHLILNYLYNKLPENLSYVHEEIFFELLESKEAHKQLDFPSQLQVEKSYGQVIFAFADDHKSNSQFHEWLTVPGHVVLPDGSRITASYRDTYIHTNDDTLIYPAESITLPLHIRSRQQGDRMSWKGLKGSKKIKDIFIDEKVHRKERDKWPIVADHNGQILWLVGLRKHNPMTTASTTYIQLVFEKRKA